MYLWNDRGFYLYLVQVAIALCGPSHLALIFGGVVVIVRWNHFVQLDDNVALSDTLEVDPHKNNVSYQKWNAN